MAAMRLFRHQQRWPHSEIFVGCAFLYNLGQEQPTELQRFRSVRNRNRIVPYAGYGKMNMCRINNRYAFAAVVAVVAIGASLIGNFLGLDKNTWPAWVQAIGSILAVFSAVYIMKRQSEHATTLAAQLEKQGTARRLASIEAIVEHGYQISTIVGKHTEPISNYFDYYFAVVDPVQIQAAMNALKAIPLHTLESYNMVFGVQEMVVALNKLEPFSEKHLNSNNIHYTFEGEDISQVNYICKKVKEARDMVRASIIELGHITTTSPEGQS